ncbi:hypothetical protein N7522_001707 [Penicillium canescens]|uniref:SH3 domain-containing protein n=1 Tax=Penicillium canescens TaxID=5083 RepID=A0AAD6NG22_PENCN|nr:uncharacterized protein N7446_008582 [Penicillium canescens]KAJ6019640.1 hypothetical protein N7522_001707 [Penicillium canescens]KAJ6033125.1 hypothetical protein N7444_010896 [Penicillium canescens]KAJ6057685.1 hypothetical protein N7460_000959 [Penicillium canescens]KAJ6058999.1 hypothetical protein N7446_008582 [Penicillium canescens]
MSDSCISLSGSSACPAWASSSISTNSSLYGSFPFLKGVSNLTEFDDSLKDYVKGSYVSLKYDELLGCKGLNTSASNDYYAQYTTSVMCSSVIQSSISDCGLSTNDALPICVDTCALWARSEEETMVNTDLCTSTDKDYTSQIYSDLIICEQPYKALSGSCIEGAANEPDNCGFASNTIGLCTYCASGTDTCCTASNATSRCDGVTIPTSTLPPLTSSSAAAAGGHHGLSGGAIAGIVIGSIAGAAILAALIAFLCIFMRRRRRNTPNEAGLNQPNPQRKGGSPSMQQAGSPTGYNMIPGGRVTRMSALREMPSSSPAYSRTSAAMYSGAKYSDASDSEGMGASPGAMSKKIPPVTGKRLGSLSSSSVLAGLESDSSPRSGTNTTYQYSSPEGVTSGQSEQLSYFRDYYSQDDIHAGDKVAVLWAYSPRAGDEFELDRGEILKVIGIWDDGWATGVRLPERAEDHDISHCEQRDSGVSNGSHLPASSSPTPSGEIKAFPLVCICLPQHWRKIIEGGQEDDVV